ncbi:hypothetical protein NKDENANG_01974 [Candidatus Entotheonellaceae bacterium PAL068K]
MIGQGSRHLDVIVTAGDRQGSRPVLGDNKAFLSIAGIPVIHYVLSAIERAHCTARLFVIGDKARLESVLAAPNSPWQGSRPLMLLEQRNTLYDNVWQAFLHTLPDYTPGMDWRVYTKTPAIDKAVLVISGDIPLAIPFEIDAFVNACDLSRYDYCMGVSTEATLRAYYPQPGRPGIQMAYFAMRDFYARQNNLHLVKPLRFGNRHYIQKMYDLRYQREWFNFLKLCWALWWAKDASWRTVWALCRLHIASLVTRCGWQQMPLLRPFFLDLQLLASLMSQLLRTRFTMVETLYGGCTLDVDNAEHYEAICTNFDAWLAYQYALANEIKQQS